jgi:hypothetical protein
MRLVHVVPHISEEASGPSYSVPRLCASLAVMKSNFHAWPRGARSQACELTSTASGLY